MWVYVSGWEPTSVKWRSRVLPWAAVDPVDEAWGRVEQAWGDAEEHRRFVGVCMALDRLPEAGRRYREVRERDPSRAESAAGHIDKLLSLASQQLRGHPRRPLDLRAQKDAHVGSLPYHADSDGGGALVPVSGMTRDG